MATAGYMAMINMKNATTMAHAWTRSATRVNGERPNACAVHRRIGLMVTATVPPSHPPVRTTSLDGSPKDGFPTTPGTARSITRVQGHTDSVGRLRRDVHRDVLPTTSVRTAATAKENSDALIHGCAVKPMAWANPPHAAAHQPT